MLYMNRRRIRDEKINQLKKGRTAYAESNELIRLIKRSIDKDENLHVLFDYSDNGCWITPIEEKKSS
ncbi:hypothetical protein [Oceanobacillus halotolerans]|uniref:hypothetical protein n=1 Tax=Oceanobacillus halotolerans TaxID=2663380 RepID=UPI0013D932A1|nr:hypothetical protein [Oceanobacillus halotolerans]